MDFKNMKISIGIVIVIVAQAFGIIWYVAQLDSTVGTLDTAVTEMKTTVATVDVAILQTEVLNLKEKINSFPAQESTDLAPLQLSISSLESRLNDLENQSYGAGDSYNDDELWENINNLWYFVEELELNVNESSDIQVESSDIQAESYDDAALWIAIEDLQLVLESLPHSTEEDSVDVSDISKLISNILEGKGATWNKSKLKERIIALETEVGIIKE